jgi:hypothetical protein
VLKDIRIKTQNTQVCRNGEEKQKQEEEEEEVEGMRKGVIYLPIYKTSTRNKTHKNLAKDSGKQKGEGTAIFLSFRDYNLFFFSSLSLSFFLSFAWWPLMISFWV